MIEWRGGSEPRSGVRVHSLYGEHREPTPEMLCGLDTFVVDMQDVGARYYTFAWTMANCMKVCAQCGIPMTILDRPNPIGGLQVEGPVLDSAFKSFVGLYPLPTRHGMTLGEVARYLHSRYFPRIELKVVSVRGWSREAFLDQTDAPWVMPSPNMPTVDTAVVYPGGCLIEGTNLSEGRGTTRPFEIVGAPFLHGRRLAESLNALGLSGVVFRALQFEPTFNKHGGRLCEGVFVHVIDRSSFAPVLTYIALLQAVVRQSGLHELPAGVATDERFSAQSAECGLTGFAWKRPPYEYEAVMMPIDILAGNQWLRDAVEHLQPLGEIRDRLAAEADAFAPHRATAMLY
jgi:uncharacterized protein YbbC (DUF1343 family)